MRPFLRSYYPNIIIKLSQELTEVWTLADCWQRRHTFRFDKWWRGVGLDLSFELKFLNLQLLFLDLECKESKVSALFATVCGTGRLAERSFVRGVSSWLTGIASGWTCSTCSAVPTARSKGMLNWKPKGKAGGFFDLLPAAEAIGKLWNVDKKALKSSDRTKRERGARGEDTWPGRDQSGD